MHIITRHTLALAATLIAAQASAEVNFYEHDNFQGRTFTTQRQIGNFERFGFNDRASSVVVNGERWERWEVCEDVRFRGRCVVLRPGQYASLGQMGLNDRVSSVRPVARNMRVGDNRYAPAPMPPAVASQVIFYERENFEGRSFAAERPVDDFGRFGFNDRASSVVVLGGPWEACTDNAFAGRCAVLRPGRYASLAAMGMNDRVSSVRQVGPQVRVEEQRYAPPPVAVYDNRRRGDERTFEADVTSVRAVVGPVEQRCWMEQEQVSQNSGGSNPGGAVVGALIGGILGHQVGGGTGKDIATAGGAVAGAVVGSRMGANGQQVQTQNVQRCTNVAAQGRPEYWDVTYSFRGTEHRIQMTTRPGPTITVNGQGEPRA